MRPRSLEAANRLFFWRSLAKKRRPRLALRVFSLRTALAGITPPEEETPFPLRAFLAPLEAREKRSGGALGNLNDKKMRTRLGFHEVIKGIQSNKE
jgi:hypothetical protein